MPESNLNKNRKEMRKEKRNQKKVNRNSYYQSKRDKLAINIQESPEIVKNISEKSKKNPTTVKPVISDHVKSPKIKVQNKNDGGLKFNKDSDRMARLQAFVNSETNKVKPDHVPKIKKSEEKSKQKSQKKSEREKSDRQKELDTAQKREISIIKKYERKLHLISRQKKAGETSIEFREHFSDILKDIESGKMENVTSKDEEEMDYFSQFNSNIEDIDSMENKKKRKIWSDEDSESEKSDMKKKKVKFDNSCSKQVQLEEKIIEDCPISPNNSDIEEYHEDIYGHLRDKKGNIVSREVQNIYKTPAQRKLEALGSNTEREQCNLMLKKQLKGMMNRLTDSTMQGVANQVESLYKKNSRNNMNEAMTTLLLETVAKPEPVPNRLIQEHALLISILSANIGCEVGAHILTEFVIRWKDNFDHYQAVKENVDFSWNEGENLLSYISYLFMFRIVDSCLIFDILNYLSETLHVMQVKLILHVLRNVGFSLRKSDPLSLKKFISEVQGKASVSEDKAFTRMQFLLEVFMALKNNNMSKIPDYDPRHGEHLKLVMKACLRKGCPPSDLRISLSDLLKSKLVGRWWIVGSAWSDGLKEELQQNVKSGMKMANEKSVYSEILMKKAKKLHCAQPPRLNILYALTEGSENCQESFQNILQLKIKDIQIKEIFNVMILCCQKAKQYNPFYVLVAENLCNHDRKYKGSLKLTLWDKFNELSNMKNSYLSNLSKFTGDLICKNGLNMAVFKNLPLSEPDEMTIKFLRLCLIVILENASGNYTVEKAFRFLCCSPKLSELKTKMRVFMSKYMLINEADKELLATRTKLALNILEKTDEVYL